VLSGGVVRVPFDPAEIIENYLYERYMPPEQRLGAPSEVNRLFSELYYRIRPWLSVALRKHFQRLYHMKRARAEFPQWPVDVTVEAFLDRLMAASMQAKGVDRLPFIWFWPDRAPSCTMLTHDVETETGLDFCVELMNINDSFGVKSAFQLVPEDRYPVTAARVQEIWDRGFEVNVHDLNHDGNLYANLEQFRKRAERINQYIVEFKAEGFRAGVLYRNLDWYKYFRFSYDMSVPNAGHLDPQRGGCCTVLPFFYGDILELPVTSVQDYSLFHVMNDYSTSLWQEQFELIRRRFGLFSPIVHPDYVIEQKARATYLDLLRFLSDKRDRGETWVERPGLIARWWKQRQQMRLAPGPGGWKIEGEGADRASVAYLVRDGSQIRYELP
jgi:hypothetical protein